MSVVYLSVACNAIQTLSMSPFTMTRKFLVVALLVTKWQIAAGQVPLPISTNGVDEIKIGMSTSEVEKIFDSKLKLCTFIILDSILQIRDTVGRQQCDSCYQNFIGTYKGVELVLTFFRYTTYEKSDFELIAITPTSRLPVVMTKSGIKVGISEKEFVRICKRNHLKYDFDGYNLLIDLHSRGCFFSDNLDDKSSKALMIIFVKGIATCLSVINLIGD
jgi:hypothetical protein